MVWLCGQEYVPIKLNGVPYLDRQIEIDNAGKLEIENFVLQEDYKVIIRPFEIYAVFCFT